MMRFPALFHIESGDLHPLEGRAIEVGRANDVDVRLDDVTVSRQQFKVAPKAGGYELSNLSQANTTTVNDAPVAGRRALAHGDRISAGASHFVYVAKDVLEEVGGGFDGVTSMRSPARIVPMPGPESPPPPASPAHPAPAKPKPAGADAPTPQAAIPTLRATPHATLGGLEIPGIRGVHKLDARTRIGRDDAGVDLRLPHPQVSRLHAELTVGRDGVSVVDMDSANGTYLNGRRLKGRKLLQEGDALRIGPYLLQFTGRSLRYATSEGNLELVARQLTRRVSDRTTGRQLTILDDISLVIRPNEFVVLLGPSGSGKSTLMKALSGRVPADAGGVTIDGEDLYARFEVLKRNMALVPQKDVVHEHLTVWSALRYTAELRLPPDTRAEEVDRAVHHTLRKLGLLERRDTRIEFLSGGQLKRVSLANELIARPSLLFLDEVTSGLDEQTDREMMDCFRKVADSGKTVVCITHSLANVDRTVDLVVFLTPGGKLAFFGSPSEALAYFGVERLGDVYDAMAQEAPEEWQRRYRASPHHTRYVTKRLPPAAVNQPDPIEPRKLPLAALGESWRQLGILTQRYTQLLLADTASLGFALGQAVFVALMLVLYFGDVGSLAEHERAAKSSTLLFLLATSSIWLGCNNAAKEVVKERDVFTRERDVNLLDLPYLGSKAIVLGVLGLLQVIVMFGICSVACGLPGSAPQQFLLLNLAILNGMALGLLISTLARSTDMAVTIVPIVLIPQVIFAGALGTLDGAAKWVAELLIVNHWAYEGSKATLPTELTELHGLDGELLLGSVTQLQPCVLLMTAAALCCAVAAWVVLARERRGSANA